MSARIPSDPMSLISQWRRDIDRAFNDSEDEGRRGEVTAAAWAPAVDIKEEGGAYVLQADLPGVDPDDVELSMENSVLTLRGQRTLEVNEDKDKYSRIERSSGTFYRRFMLPDTADFEHISAKYTNGVLEVRIPKQEKVLPRRIEVQS
ncbi:MAG: Hsp20/alpha crystallin family protein [Gammaproteobacteria bacterium]|nr:Hsp20/alpha crystallin family protein [Gammaproteobacteria bacterium]